MLSDCKHVLVISVAKLTNKCLNVREQVEMIERNKDGPSLPLFYRESLMYARENADRKSLKTKNEILHYIIQKITGNLLPRILPTTNSNS